MRTRQGIRSAGYLFVGFLVASCCCKELIEEATKRCVGGYDELTCVSVAKGKGCVRIEPTFGEPPVEGHLEIEARHQITVKGCRGYQPGETQPRAGIRLEQEGVLEQKVTAINLEVDEESVSFKENDETASELSELFGGTWVAWQGGTITPVGESNDYELGYRLVWVEDLPKSGNRLPRGVDYAIAVEDPETGEWLFGESSLDIDYDPVVISFVDPKGGGLPWTIPQGSDTPISSVTVKSSEINLKGLSAYSVLSQSDVELSRIQLVRAFNLGADQNLKAPVSFDTRGLAPGVYTATIEVIANEGSPRERVVGTKYLPVRITAPTVDTVPSLSDA